jgi:hypothetical protein
MLRNRPLTILSPSINCEFFDKQIKRTGAGDSVNDKQISMETNDGIDSQVKTIFLSLNRFERKKCIELAIHSFGNNFIKIKFIKKYLQQIIYANIRIIRKLKKNVHWSLQAAMIH